MDTTKIDSDLVSKIIELSQDDAMTSRPEGVEELYEEFLSKFPKNKITELTQEQYCLGQGSITDNYCRWIERELQPMFGRYMPGTARGHLLYLQKDGTLYKHQSLSDLSDDDALSYVLKIHQVIIDADVNADITWIDQDNEVYDRAGVEPRCVMGAGRRARLVSIYNPDIILPISSTVHIKHFLKAFGLPESEIPPYKNVIQRLLILTGIYQSIKKHHDLDITPRQFMSVLYSDKLGIKPKKVTIDANTNNELSELSANVSDSDSLNQIIYGPPGTGKTYSTTWRAVSLADPEWYFELKEQDLALDDQRDVIKERYDELVSEQRIAFTTFHQSFAYEDFVEGIRAKTDNDTKQISYDIEDGIFKQIADRTANIVTRNKIEGLAEKPKFWKISLGDSEQKELREYCFDNNEARIGWGYTGDLSTNLSERSQQEKEYLKGMGSNDRSSIKDFSENIEIGDVLLCLKDQKTIRSVGIVTSDYVFDTSFKGLAEFHHTRKVNWILRDINFDIYTLNNNTNLTQKTCYKINRFTWDDLAKSLEHQDYSLDSQSISNSPKASNNHVLIIDEINRGNISRIFGELITLLEPDKRKGGTDAREVILPYSKEKFSVPSNLYVLGTMNTADKSLAQLDLALRRRFDFIELLPQPELLDSITVHGIAVSEILTVINQRIEVLLDREHTIGHSYFWSLKDLDSDDEKEIELGNIFKRRIIPLLQEYFFSDWERIGWVLNDLSKPHNEKFIQTESILPRVSELFHSRKGLNDRRYYINETTFNNPESYKKILIQPKSKSSDDQE